MIPIALRCQQVLSLHGGGERLAQLLEDDFFYYLVVAKTFLSRGFLSFDGVTETNGYHPLWFLVVCSLQAVADAASVPSLPLFVVLSSSVLPVVSAWQLYRLLAQAERSEPHESVPGPELLLRAAFALLYGVCAFQVSFGGMEVGLTLALAPRYFALALQQERPRGWTAKFSFWASLVVLSRLDSLLLVGPTWLWAMAQPLLGQQEQTEEPRLRRSGGLAHMALSAMLGWGPLALYLGANWLVFGALLPESARAKALTVGPGPFSATLLSFGKAPTTMALGLLCVVVSASAIAVLVRAIRAGQRVSFVLLYGCLWPVLFYAVLSFRSPWAFWAWYLYPVVMSLVPLSLLLRRTMTAERQSQALRAALTFAVVCAGAVAAKEARRVVRGIPENTIFAGATRIKAFADRHPGYYAMGDRAGMVGYLLSSPVLQLEGLVGGRKVLEAIAAERPLTEFLRDAGVDFYIGTNLQRSADGCLLAVEPAQAREGAPHMVGSFCDAPVYRFSVGGFTTTIHALKRPEHARVGQ